MPHNETIQRDAGPPDLSIFLRDFVYHSVGEETARKMADLRAAYYARHALSNRLLFQGFGRTKVLPFTQVHDQGLGTHQGETFNMFRVTSLAVPTDATLNESMRTIQCLAVSEGAPIPIGEVLT